LPQARARFMRQSLGLAPRQVHDGLGLLPDTAMLLLVVGEQVLRLLAQATRLVELLPDCLGALIERLGDQARHLVVEQDHDEDDEGHSNPELGHLQHGTTYSAARCTSAFCTSSLLTSLPISRVMMAPAMSLTPAKAFALVSAMRLSASASLAATSASTFARSLSTSAARVSRMDL